MAVRIIRRTAQMLLVVLGAVTLAFFVLRLAAGDPARLVNPPGTPEEVVTQVRERLRTDKPLLVQRGEELTGAAPPAPAGRRLVRTLVRRKGAVAGLAGVLVVVFVAVFAGL